MFENKKFVDNAQQCFAFTSQANFPYHIYAYFEFSLKVKVMGSNAGYLLIFLLYSFTTGKIAEKPENSNYKNLPSWKVYLS